MIRYKGKNDANTLFHMAVIWPHTHTELILNVTISLDIEHHPEIL